VLAEWKKGAKPAFSVLIKGEWEPISAEDVFA
jgi:hypothetical protein